MLNNALTERVPSGTRSGGLLEIQRILEHAIDKAKTKQGDAIVILVGGGSVIIDDKLSGVRQLIRPEYLEVANAIGAAVSEGKATSVLCTCISLAPSTNCFVQVGKVSGFVDTVSVPGTTSLEQQLEEAKLLATERCITAGGDPEDVEIIEVDLVPISYLTNGATRIMVRAISDLVESQDMYTYGEESVNHEIASSGSRVANADKASDYQVTATVDIESYKPRIEGDLWYVSPTDLDFLQDGSGVLGVGSCGEPYPTYLACLEWLKSGEPITIRRQGSIKNSETVLVSGLMVRSSLSVPGRPLAATHTIWLTVPRAPHLSMRNAFPGCTSEQAILSLIQDSADVNLQVRVKDAILAVAKVAGLDSFDAIIPNEIGGLNAFEALLAAARLHKSVLDTDCVARAYPYLWQTVRCLQNVSVAPVAVADGQGRSRVRRPVRQDM